MTKNFLKGLKEGALTAQAKAKSMTISQYYNLIYHLWQRSDINSLRMLGLGRKSNN